MNFCTSFCYEAVPRDLNASLADTPVAHHMADVAASLDNALALVLTLSSVISAQGNCSALLSDTHY